MKFYACVTHSQLPHSGGSFLPTRSTNYSMLQAVEAEDAADEDTDVQRRKRLREERSASLAYDAEQSSLRASLLERLHSSEAAGARVSAEAASSDDDGGGLTVKSRHKASTSQARCCSDRGRALPSTWDCWDWSFEGAFRVYCVCVQSTGMSAGCKHSRLL
jgi:hypothetical protein